MKTLILLIFFFSLNTLALTKDEALKLTKSRIAALETGFRKLANNCYAASEDCQVETNSQIATLKWLSFEWPLSEISYSSGADNFMIDGAVRIAKTGKSWSTPVIFNEDLLTREISAGNYEALDFFEVLGILVHEYGHHQEAELLKVGLPALEHQELDELAVKVVTYLKDRTRQIRITEDEVPNLKQGHELNILQIDIEYFNGIRNIWSNIYIDGLAETKEISHNLVRTLKCPKEYFDGHLTFVGVPYYVSFRKVQAPRIEFKDSVLYIDQNAGDASVFCIDEKKNTFQVFDDYTNGRMRFAFVLNADGNLEFFDRASYVEATPPPDQMNPL